jgi:H+-transporting ATPase
MAESTGTDLHSGLRSAEAARRLHETGPNLVPDEEQNQLLAFLLKFWAPVPWMLEATVVFELLLRKRVEAVVIGLLLVFNAAISLLQERKAHNALALLRKRLPLKARVLRDSEWRVLEAQEVVPGDIVHVRIGDVIPADVRIRQGEISLDQSTLTGESLPVEAASGALAYAGSLVKRGEATGEVSATGTRTYFGKTAQLVGTAKTVSHLQTIIFGIIKYLVIFDLVLVALLMVYSRIAGLPLGDTLPFALILLIASVPVALPATFTLATALGSLELAGQGVIVTRLSSIEEAAAMDILLSDKTGTITENSLTVAKVQTYSPYSEEQLLRAAALASDEATQDPIDLSILRAAQVREPSLRLAMQTKFIPFDPATKLSEGFAVDAGNPVHALKGAPVAVARRVTDLPAWEVDVARLSQEGYRVLAVAEQSREAMRLVGLIALEDPPRGDSKVQIANLRALGVRTIMVTGDGVGTARSVGEQVGIGDRVCTHGELKQPLADSALACDIFAGIYPEDKFALVRAMQQAGHVTGMTGDGVNDAPALKQAEVGIAVSTATDVAKAAASVVLTNAGLGDILAAVQTSRRIYQRMLTYTLNKITKTIEIAIFLPVGVVLTKSFVITPLLIVLLLFTNDFVTMAIATDRVSFSAAPDRWRMRTLMATAAALAALLLVFSFSVLAVGWRVLHLPLDEIQTLTFVMLVFTGQSTVYLVRERGHFWHSRPSRWLLLSSAADIIVVTGLATRGVLMAAIPIPVTLILLGAVAIVFFILDFLKIQIFRVFALR